MNRPEQIPFARPLEPVEPVGGLEHFETPAPQCGTEISPCVAAPILGPPPPPIRPQTERLALGSAMMGIFGFVPVVCQVAGLILGVMGLLRIRRARRNGVPLTGAKWAVFGLGGNGFLLLCWLGIFGVMIGLRTFFSHSADTLHALIPLAP